MRIALIAHDKKKADIVALAMRHSEFLAKHELYATGTTGGLIMENTGLPVTRMQSGAMVASGTMDCIIFLRDPLTAQPHEPDVSALLRLSDVHGIPLATNLKSAEILLKALESGIY